MNLLAGKLYDPAVAVTKATSTLLAMTAMDTTNLRLAFVVPPSGIVRVRMEGTIHGATTFPTVLLGVLEGATVRGRVAPKQTLGNTAVATAMVDVAADFLVTGLTPGASLNWDAAYGVETVVAATGIKYGGPNDTTLNNAFGGFAFEIWDVCPIYTPTSGTAPTSPVSARIDLNSTYIDTEVAAIKVKTDFLPSATAGAAGGVFIAGTNAATSITTALTANITGNLSGSVGSVTGLTASNLDATVSSRMATYAQPTGFLAASFPTDPADQSLVIAATDAIMTSVGTRLASASYTAPLDAAATRAAIGMAAANLDTQIATLLPTASYAAPDNASITAIKAKTDSMTFTIANRLDTNTRNINSVAVGGSGTTVAPWGPV